MAPMNLGKFGKIFPGSETFRDAYSQYFLPLLRFSELSGVKKIFFKISKCQNSNYGPTVKILSFEKKNSQTWNFQGLFLAILSTISESFINIWGQKIYQKNFKVLKKAQINFFISIPDFFSKKGLCQEICFIDT